VKLQNESGNRVASSLDLSDGMLQSSQRCVLFINEGRVAISDIAPYFQKIVTGRGEERRSETQTKHVTINVSAQKLHKPGASSLLLLLGQV